MDFTGERVILGLGQRPTAPLELEHAARYEFAAAYAAGKTVIDVACGTGYGSAILTLAGARRVFGYDNDQDTIDYAKTQFRSRWIRFDVADAIHLPKADASVDMVASFETIEHLPSPEDFVAEVARVLRPSGLFVLSTPDRPVYNWADFPNGLANPFHISELTRPELRKMLAADFEIELHLGQSPVPEYATARLDDAPATTDDPELGDPKASFRVGCTNRPCKYQVVVARRRGAAHLVPRWRRVLRHFV
jgi:SAM-dependent methyltransferase